MEKLFTPIEMNHLTAKNRLVRSATWEGIASGDGSLPEEAYSIYEELASGGVGTIITGFTSVDANDCYFGGMMRLCSDALIPEYARLVRTIHDKDCRAVAQLALGAYYRREGKRIVQAEPDDMREDEIRLVIRMFSDAAARAEAAGFDGVQIHAAHFFFLSRFISPACNHRKDSWGGSPENRGRILLEILEGIRRQAPKLHCTIKINCSDFTPGGLGEDEFLELCRLLDRAGIDSIEVSGNGTSMRGVRAHAGEGYFVPAAASAAETVSCPVIVVGGFRSADTCEAVLEQTKIRMISLSRPLLCEPDLPARWEHDPSAVSRCVSCNGCYSSEEHRCIFRSRDFEGRA